MQQRHRIANEPHGENTSHRRNAAAIHASHTPHRRREDEPRRSTNAAQIPNAAHRWRGTRSRRACRAYEKSRFPYPFFFSLGFIYILYFLCFFLSFLAAIARKPRICSHFLRSRRGSRRRSERESRAHSATSERETNAKRGRQAAARLSPLRFFPIISAFIPHFLKCPTMPPNFAAIAFLAIGRTFTPPTPQTRQGHTLHNRVYTICTMRAALAQY